MLYCGVPDSVIITEEKSRNTRESATYTKQLLHQLNMRSKTILLVTSAFHIPRALGCFRKVGLKLDGYGVDYYNGDSSLEFDDLVPSGNAIDKWGS